ncbi:predicted protein [Naegleria gruberi]|uniref:Predicted protein n=1 Tax=Naegleria gruberi TaxID=5762 RepID=D2VKL6_NAEGR|nr:uncharacterized protein NAEGRDRAFT_69437 [Naegleria gruberi]EFC42617.1 predicted protein [Naegleria gruberi]|eukprot:XP_002675361.1 predicted protein [Naegleria gruberi strain NEG-M]
MDEVTTLYPHVEKWLKSIVHNFQDFKEAMSALTTIKSICQNIILQPSDEKVKKIRLTNPRFVASVGKLPGAINLLCLIGFDKVIQDKEEYLIFGSNDLTPLKTMQSVISAIIKSNDLNTESTNPIIEQVLTMANKSIEEQKLFLLKRTVTDRCNMTGMFFLGYASGCFADGRNLEWKKEVIRIAINCFKFDWLQPVMKDIEFFPCLSSELEKSKYLVTWLCIGRLFECYESVVVRIQQLHSIAGSMAMFLKNRNDEYFSSWGPKWIDHLLECIDDAGICKNFLLTLTCLIEDFNVIDNFLHGTKKLIVIANILVSGSNKLFICLCDFDFVNDNLTTSLSIVGTPKYLPPEMISQGILLKKNSTKIDIWCFGIIIFRILCELLGIDCFSDCPEEILVEDDIRLGRAKDSEQLRQYLDKKLSTSELLINYTLGEGRRITRFIELTRQLLEYQYEKRPNASTLIELIQTP